MSVHYAEDERYLKDELTEPYVTIVQELEKYDIDILAVQEINTKGTAITHLKKYIWCIGGDEQNRLGTGFIIKEEHKDKIIDYGAINERLSIIRIKGK
ncbi:hypothetical protein ILUMI_14767 [Ignelater luminosus]|uniref:Endonuclease/exonuclease/phosphatase domain-containing protein n=1 Tax=Ignelater luminosus TaxID=2038154 RepID=A0A8K0GA61_IGNLU|nr:hypothetical protein ILUMI_14767 [Ignelater luminosus]